MNIKQRSTLEKYESKLRFKKYSENTIKTYVYYASDFLNNFNTDIYHISKAKAIEFISNKKYSSTAYQNQYISAVKSIYKYVVGVELSGISIERPRKQKKLPRVIDKNHLLSIIDSIQNIKHKAIISLAYSVGLRVSEVINLKISDIDSERMVIYIRNAKGQKDRIVPLSEKILFILREYYQKERPFKYLFNGQNLIQYTSSSCNKIVKKYLGESYHFHLLRHSSFTSMLESGTDISVIQKIAGHQSYKTTLIYTQISNQLLKQANLPI